MNEEHREGSVPIVAVIHACPVVRAQLQDALRTPHRRVVTAANREALGSLAELIRTNAGSEDAPPCEPPLAPVSVASEVVFPRTVVMPYAVGEGGNGVPVDPSPEPMENALALIGGLSRWQQPMTLSGGLSEVPFASLVTWLQIGRLTGSVRVAHGGNLARFYLEDGAVRTAELNTGETGAEAIERVLGWTEGSFDVSFGSGGPFAATPIH